MSFLSRNLVAFQVAGVCALFAWLFGGLRGEYLMPVVPWVVVILLEGLICFPQRREFETTYEARERVWHDLSKDPLTWVVFCFILILAIPFFNTGLCEVCDCPAIAEGARPEPPIPFAPFCVRRMDHLNVFFWFVPSLLALIVTKHALLKSGKRLMLRLIVWNGLGLAALGAIQQMTGAKGPFWQAMPNNIWGSHEFYSAWGYANVAGDYFTTLFCLAAGLWRWDFEQVSAEHEQIVNEGGADKPRRNWFWRKHVMLIPAVIFFFSAINTLSRSAILIVASMAILVFLHTFFCLFAKMKKLQRFKVGVFCMAVLAVIAFAAFAAMPKNVQKEVNTIDTTGVLNRVTGKGSYHVRVATEVWKDHLLFGCGGWGYKHFCLPKMADKDIRSQQGVGGINVHNDYLQFLCEHGVVGFGLIVVIVMMMLMPIGHIWYALINSVRFLPSKKQPARPIILFVMPAPVFFILLSLVGTVIHGFGDCPFRAPSVLVLFFVLLAAMDGFLPRRRESGES